MDDIRDNPPDFLRSDEELHYYRTIYDDLIRNKTPLQFKDRTTIGMLASNLAQFDQANDDISENGFTITYQGDRKEITKINPAVGVLKECKSEIRQYLKEFGMSPSSRTSSFSLNGGELRTKMGDENKNKAERFNR